MDALPGEGPPGKECVELAVKPAGDVHGQFMQALNCAMSLAGLGGFKPGGTRKKSKGEKYLEKGNSYLQSELQKRPIVIITSSIFTSLIISQRRTTSSRNVWEYRCEDRSS